MKTNVSSLFIGVFLLVIYSAYSEEKKMENIIGLFEKATYQKGVFLEIDSDKDEVFPFDKIIIKYRIINNSGENMSFLPNIISRDSALLFFDGDERLYKESNVHIEWSFFPAKEKFIILKDGEFFEYEMLIRSKLGFMYYGNKIHIGRSLYFSNSKSYIPLKRIKEIKIKGQYFLVESEKKQLEKFGLPSSVNEKIYSNEIKLTIK